MSSAAIRTLIVAEISTLGREVREPSPPFGYGRGIGGWTDMDQSDAPAANEDLALAQELLRRVITPRGSLPGTSPEERDYGVDLRLALNAPLTRSAILKHEMEAGVEMRKDDRVRDVQITLRTNGRDTLDLSARITRADNGQSFTFTGTINTIGIQALSVAA